MRTNTAQACNHLSALDVEFVDVVDAHERVVFVGVVRDDHPRDHWYAGEFLDFVEHLRIGQLGKFRSLHAKHRPASTRAARDREDDALVVDLVEESLETIDNLELGVVLVALVALAEIVDLAVARKTIDVANVLLLGGVEGNVFEDEFDALKGLRVVDVVAIDSRLVVCAEAHGAIRLHLEDNCRQVGRRRVDRRGHVEGRGGEEGPAQSIAQGSTRCARGTLLLEGSPTCPF